MGWERQTRRKGCPHSHMCGAGTSLPLWQPRLGDILGVHSTEVSGHSMGHTHTTALSGQHGQAAAPRHGQESCGVSSCCRKQLPQALPITSHLWPGPHRAGHRRSALLSQARHHFASSILAVRQLQGTAPSGSRQRHAGLASGRAELTVSIPQASPSARGHIHRPRNADVLQVCPMALAPGLPGAALGSPPSGCQSPDALLTLSGGQG